MGNLTPFGLSRIEAEGWNAACKYLLDRDPADTKAIATLNPYTSPLERERWFAGFNNAAHAGARNAADSGWSKAASVITNDAAVLVRPRVPREAECDGWSIAVSGRSASGNPRTRHYVVAMAVADEALAAVKAVLQTGETAAISSAVDVSLLSLRNMAAGEVRLLGKPHKRH